jgi:hypothetical protein
MDTQTIRHEAEEQLRRAQRFGRSAADIKREINHLRQELAEHHRHEVLWAQQTTTSSVPVIGAGALARTMRETHRIKNLIRGLEQDLRNVEQLCKDAQEKAHLFQNLAHSAESGNKYALYQADKVA